MTEVWKDIPDYEGLYQVSNLGRVKSLPRVSRFVGRWGKETQRIVPGGIRTARVQHPGGYLFLNLSKGGKKKRWSVHTLVLTAFVGPRPDGMECLHRDGDPSNNRVENLRWGTAQENAADMLRHGTQHNARKTHCKHGHEFNAENTYRDSDGNRQCRTCKRLWQRKYEQRNISK